MNEQAYLLIIGAIIGFLSATLKDFINHYLKSKKEKDALALKRLEESFIYLSKSYSYCTKIFTKNIDNSRNNNIEENTDSIKLAFQIRTYFPELMKEFNNFSTSYNDFGSFQISKAIEFNQTIKSQGYSEKLFDELFKNYYSDKEYFKLYESFIIDYKNLCDAIIKETKKYNK